MLVQGSVLECMRRDPLIAACRSGQLNSEQILDLAVNPLLSLPDCDAASMISAGNNNDLKTSIAIQVSKCDAMDER